jgi:hypothetical protein
MTVEIEQGWLDDQIYWASFDSEHQWWIGDQMEELVKTVLDKINSECNDSCGVKIVKDKNPDPKWRSI